MSLQITQVDNSGLRTDYAFGKCDGNLFKVWYWNSSFSTRQQECESLGDSSDYIQRAGSNRFGGVPGLS